MPDAGGTWYYCLDHKRVESKDGCRSINRFGPYSTREEAEQAMQKVAERNDEWDEADRDWDNPRR